MPDPATSLARRLSDDELAFEIGWSIEDHERLARALECALLEGADAQDLRARLAALCEDLRIMRLERLRRAAH